MGSLEQGETHFLIIRLILILPVIRRGLKNGLAGTAILLYLVGRHGRLRVGLPHQLINLLVG